MKKKEGAKSSDVDIFAKKRAQRKRKHSALQDDTKTAGEKAVNGRDGSVGRGGKVAGRGGKVAGRGGKVAGRGGKVAGRGGKGAGRGGQGAVREGKGGQGAASERKSAGKGGQDAVKEGKNAGKGGKNAGKGGKPAINGKGGKGGVRAGRGGGKVVGKGKAEAGQVTERKGKSEKEKERRRARKKLSIKKRGPRVWSTEKLEVTKSLRKEIASRVDTCNRRTLHVKLPSTLVVNQVEDVKEALGGVVAGGDVRLRPLKPNKARSCIIEFKSEVKAKKCKTAINEMKFKEEMFIANFSTSQESGANEELDALKLRVGLLPPRTTRTDLKNAFSTACKIEFTRRNKFKNIAFILYKTKNDALGVFKSSRGIKINGRPVLLTFSKFQPAPNKNEGKDKGKTKQQDTEAKDVAPPPSKKKKVGGKDTKPVPVKNNDRNGEVHDEDMEDDDENEEEEAEDEEDVEGEPGDDFDDDSAEEEDS